MPYSIPKPAHQPYAVNRAGMNVNRGFDGSVQGMGMSPEPPAPQSRLDILKAKVRAGATLTDDEHAEYVRLSGVAVPKLPGPPAGTNPPEESPYDLVGGGYVSGVRIAPRPRWEVDADRRKEELARQKAEMEMEQMRWMFDQMRRNPYGMSIRDLIYGRGGK